jgi:ubiquinol-cytochrome c reductase cytochrome c1 subunit
MLKRVLLMAVAGVAVAVAAAPRPVSAEEGLSLPNAGTDINDVQSLQRGARNFMNYCSGCHSLTYLRYNRMAKDLQIPEPELQGNLMFATSNPFDSIVSAMPSDAQTWFGKQPPDLTLIARLRGVDYIYAYLKDYYVDKARPWGANNLVLPGTAMPPVLSGLQGLQKPVFKNEPDEHGGANMVLVGVEPLSAGTMKPEEYDQFVRDISNFLDYAGEPVKAKRQSMGVFVILFLLVFFVFAFLLKKEYWKDVH